MFLTVLGYRIAVIMAHVTAVKPYPCVSVIPGGWDVSVNCHALMDNHKRILPVYATTAIRVPDVIAFAIDMGNVFRANVSVTVDGGVSTFLLLSQTQFF